MENSRRHLSTKSRSLGPPWLAHVMWQNWVTVPKLYEQLSGKEGKARKHKPPWEPQTEFSSSVIHVDFSSSLFPFSQARPQQIGV